jgi:hypothetical protein
MNGERCPYSHTKVELPTITPKYYGVKCPECGARRKIQPRQYGLAQEVDYEFPEHNKLTIKPRGSKHWELKDDRWLLIEE